MLPLLLLLNGIVAPPAQPPKAAPQPIDLADWFTAKDYPTAALRAGLEGVVGYALDVDAKGKVSACTITASSGQELLDAPTCALLRKRGHFVPVHDQSGKAIASVYSRNIHWRLPPPPPLAPASAWLGARRAPASKYRVPGLPAAEKTPEPVVDPAATKPPPDPRVLFGQLPNGMRYAILANANPVGSVSFRFRIGVGSVDETPAQAGYAHLLEHMIFRGSTNVPDGEFERSLEQVGLAMGSDTTAFTFPDHTLFGLDFPPSQMSNVTTGLFLLREVADRATIPEAALPAVKGVVLSERRVRDTAEQRMGNARLNFLLPGQPETRPTIGTVDAVTKASVEGLRAFYRDQYRPERSMLIVVGNVEPGAIEADIKARFGDWKAGGTKPVAPAPITIRRAPAVKLFVEPGAPKVVQIEWQSPFDTRPDDYAREADYVADALLFEILNRRFLHAAGHPGAPFSAAGIGEGGLFRRTIDTTISVRPLDGKLHAAIAAVLAEQRRLLLYGVSQGEVDHAVAGVRARLDQAAAASDTRASSDLANALLANLEADTIFATPRQQRADIERMLARIGIAEINKTAARVFAGSGPLLFVSDNVPPAGGETALKATLASAMVAHVARPISVATVAWPYSHFGPPGQIVERKMLDDIGVLVVRFANGTTATIRQSPGTGEVLLNLAFGAGLSGLPPDRDHALWLVSQAPQTLVSGGLGRADLADIDDAFLGKTYGATLITDESRFQLIGRTRPEDLEAEAQLLTAYVVDPAFRTRALRDAIFGAESLGKQLAASVPLTAVRDTPFLLHDRDPRWRGPPTADDLKATTDADLPALLRPALAGPLNLVIVGDIDFDRAVEVARNTVGALPPRGPRPVSHDAHFPAPSPQPVLESVPGATAQAFALAAWPTPPFAANMAEARAIQVLSEVIKGRLMAGLREREGLTYAPQTFVDQAIGYGRYAALGVQVELPPAKVTAFFSELDAIVRDLAQTPVSAEELARARTPMVDSSQRGFALADYWSDALAASDDNPLYFEMIRSKLRDLEKVTAADLQRLAGRYLAGRSPFRFVVQPSAPTAPGVVARARETGSNGARHR